MSYEYELIFEESNSLQDLFEKLLESEACTTTNFDEIHIIDPQTTTTGSYNARLLKFDDKRAWLEILIPTTYLFELFAKILFDARFRCLEDGDTADEVSLKQAFHIKNIT